MRGFNEHSSQLRPRSRGTLPPTKRQLRTIRYLESLTGQYAPEPQKRGQASERIAVLRRTRSSGLELSALDRRDQRAALRISGLVSMWEAGLSISEIAGLCGTSSPAVGNEIEQLRRAGHPFPLRSMAPEPAAPVGAS